ncbi:MAG: MoaD/ThiS family protein [Sporichthyaceae bacterium]
MARGMIRYWAAARAAAGTQEEPFDGSTLGEVLDTSAATRGPEFARVLARSSFLVDGMRAKRDDRLGEAAVIEVLPPFAGG